MYILNILNAIKKIKNKELKDNVFEKTITDDLNLPKKLAIIKWNTKRKRSIFTCIKITGPSNTINQFWKKMTKRSKIITKQAKTLENSKIIDIKSVTKKIFIQKLLIKQGRL